MLNLQPYHREGSLFRGILRGGKAVGSTVWQGDVTTLEDLNRVGSGSYTEITGDLRIQQINDNLTSIDLPQLQSIGGGFIIGSNGILASVDLPQLQSIDGNVILGGNDSLASIDLPQLQSIGGWVKVSGNDTITAIDLPQLQSVGDDILIEGSNDNLATISFPQLQVVDGDVYILGDLTDCDLGSYTEQYCP